MPNVYRTLTKFFSLCLLTFLSPMVLSQNTITRAPVSVIRIHSSNTQQNISAIGTIIAPLMAVITTQVTGVVEKILFENGQHVVKKQILLKLDSQEQLAAYATSKAQYKIAIEKYQRSASLLQSHVIAKQDVDDLKNVMEQAKAEFDQSTSDLEYREIIAPFSGILTEKKVSVGDYLTPGQAIVTIVNTSLLKVNYKLDEKQLPLLQLGQIVTLQSDASPHTILKAKLTYIAPNVDQLNRTVQLQATIINPSAKLRPGMYVNIKQPLQKNTAVFWVPEQAIVPSFNKKVIYIIIHGKAQAIPIKTIDSKPGFVAITGNIPENALCVVAGQQKLKTGMQVDIIKNTPTR